MTMSANKTEGVPNVSGRIVTLTAKTNKNLNLHHLLTYLTMTGLLALTHIDGTTLKTDKATLNMALESHQTEALKGTDLPNIKAMVVDGGSILHENILQHTRASYGMKA